MTDLVKAASGRFVKVSDADFVGAEVVGTTNAPTTTSGTFAVIPEMTLTATVSNDVFVMFSGSFNLLTGDNFEFSVFMDGVEQTAARRALQYTSSAGALDPAGSIGGIVGVTQTLIINPSSGSHTFDIRWRALGGTARARSTYRSLVIQEVP